MTTQPHTPAVSVIICTCNPRADLFKRVLDSLEEQTLPSSRFEVILVDNNSNPPLAESELTLGRAMTLSVINETKQGLSHARSAGIKIARGRLFIFVDDDNFLAENYLEEALKIHEADPTIGAFGGISDPILERPIGKFKTKLLPYLGVRDYGPEPITSAEPHWGKWEPIGAGMTCRRDVCEKYVHTMESIPDAGDLGRKGTALLSGEDSLFARVANQMGYSCSYQPTLRLQHFIKKERLTLKYLARLIEGHGRSYVVLQRVLGRPTEGFGWPTAFARLAYRIKTAGLTGALMWFWDLGYRRQAAQPRDAEAPTLATPAARPGDAA